MSADSSIAQSSHSLSDSLTSSVEKENIFGELLHHVRDASDIEIPFLGHIHLPHAELFGIDFSPTKHIVFLWLAAVILIVLLTVAARKNLKNKTPKGLGNLVEIFVVFIRDEIVLSNMGPAGLRYLPYLLTTFFFILVMNLLGLLPYGASPTGNVNITGGLAVIAFVMIQFSAIRSQGIGHYLSHLTGGVHWLLWPIMIPIEILGLFTKPFALCIRLFANMLGGHMGILAIIGLIFVFKSFVVAPISIGFVLALTMLEIFVAFLQAYIFTIITALFMGLGMQQEEQGRGH